MGSDPSWAFHGLLQHCWGWHCFQCTQLSSMGLHGCHLHNHGRAALGSTLCNRHASMGGCFPPGKDGYRVLIVNTGSHTHQLQSRMLLKRPSAQTARPRNPVSTALTGDGPTCACSTLGVTAPLAPSPERGPPGRGWACGPLSSIHASCDGRYASSAALVPEPEIPFETWILVSKAMDWSKHGNGLQVRHIEKVSHAAQRSLKLCPSEAWGFKDAIAANAAQEHGT